MMIFGSAMPFHLGQVVMIRK